MGSNDTIIVPNSEWVPSLEHVYAKTSWAKHHLETLEAKVKGWIDSHPYSIAEKDNPERTLHCFVIKPRTADVDIPLIAGDFVNCLRSALDQLAWNLVHLYPETIPTTNGAKRQVVFPICETDAAYVSKRRLFHPDIGKALDLFQPQDRANAFRSHALWQLDRLWNIDKHKAIAVNCCKVDVAFYGGMKGQIDYFDDSIIAVLPSLSRISLRPTYLKPRITPQILFGDYMGDFEITTTGLRDIYEFVTKMVIPRFAGFFP
jgi:hypothetical protein